MNFQKLTVENVNGCVSKNATGIYFLGYKKNGDVHIKYIGRSDTRLRSRLIDHIKANDEDYSHFSFEITNTILKAYKIECREWHNAVALDNKIHPRKPKNITYKCPYCKKENGGYTTWNLNSKE